MKNKTWKEKLRKITVLAAVLTLFFAAGSGQTAYAAKINDCTIVGISKLAGGSGTKLFTSVKFSGNKVTLKGKFKAKLNGQKKTVTSLTILVASNCKYYEAWDSGLHSVKKSKMRNYLQQGSFIQLDVTVKSGKVVRFINGA